MLHTFYGIFRKNKRRSLIIGYTNHEYIKYNNKYFYNCISLNWLQFKHKRNLFKISDIINLFWNNARIEKTQWS